MPRVTFVKKARKDNPAVKKGESYYWWKFRFGPKRYSATKPKRSQLTTSEYYAAVWDLEDSFSISGRTKEEAFGVLDDAISTVEEIQSEIREKIDNMDCYEGLSQSPVHETLENREMAMEELLDALNDARTQVEELDEDAAWEQELEERGEDYDEEESPLKLEDEWKTDWFEDKMESINSDITFDVGD